MDNTMVSIGKYIENNFTSFGLVSAADLHLIERSQKPLEDGSKRLIVLAMRTFSDDTFGVPFGYLSNGQRGERFMTLVEFECKTRAPEPSVDFFWNTARQFRDKVYDTLAGPGRCGITIPRYDWTDQENPVQDGKIWFEVNPKKSTPREDPLEDPNDPANKSIFLTYNVHWLKPLSQ
jgi:hypothetical protein